MKYFGGKSRVAKHIASFLQPMAMEATAYVEPMVGGAWVVSKIRHPFRIASDINPALVRMWHALTVDGWEPPETITESDYNFLRRLQDPDNPLTAFAGFGCSWGGKWFGGYARSGTRNYAGNAAGSLRKKAAGLSGVIWGVGDYRDVYYPCGSLVYFDPPYQGTTGFDAAGAFEWDSFWSFVRTLSRSCRCFVSEYSAPPDFVSVFQVMTQTDVRTRDGKAHRTERIFVVESEAKTWGAL